MLKHIVHALAASLLSAGVGALQFKTSSTGSPDVAAVVPTYVEDFDKIEPFLRDWENCSVGQRNLDIYVIFSSQAEANKFDKFYGGRGPWNALVISDPAHDKNHLRSWKKLDGLAQLLASSHYKYVLMMDCEIAVKKCDGFADLAHNLNQKFLAKTWYGASTTNKMFNQHVEGAACSVVNCFEPGSLDALQAASKNFQLNTWWNDIPWTETTSAKQMFEKWGERVEAKNSKERALQEGMAAAGGNATQIVQRDKALLTGDYVGILHAAIDGGILGGMTTELADLDPVAVADELSPQAKDPVLRNANGAFEHLIYQFHMILYNGFVIHDLSQEGLGFTAGCQPGHCRGNSLESFWVLYETESKQAQYVSLVRPLWIPQRKEYTSVTDYIPLAFHTDRGPR